MHLRNQCHLLPFSYMFPPQSHLLPLPTMSFPCVTIFYVQLLFLDNTENGGSKLLWNTGTCISITVAS